MAFQLSPESCIVGVKQTQRVVGEVEHCGFALNIGNTRDKPLVIRGSSVHRILEKPEGVQNTESIPGRGC